MATGREEKEAVFYVNMEQKLKKFPYIFTKYYDYLKNQNKSYMTISVYFDHVFNFYNYFFEENSDLDDFLGVITLENVDAYMASSETKQTKKENLKTSESFQQVRYSSLNNFFDWLKQSSYMEYNPIESVKRAKSSSDKNITYLTSEEIQELHEIICDTDDQTRKSRDLAIFVLAINTGLKASELCNLNLDDLDLENSFLGLNSTKDNRKLSFGKYTKNILQKWLDIRENEYNKIDTNALFISQKRKRLSVDALTDLINKYVEYSSISKKVTLNTLRATAICYLLQHNVHIDDVAEYFGITEKRDLIAYYKALEHKNTDISSILENLLFDVGKEITDDEDIYINTNLEDPRISIEEDQAENAEDESNGVVLYTNGDEKIIEYGLSEFGCSDYEDDIQKITLPNSIVSIGKFAFYSCSLKKIILPSKLSYIGESAFSKCGITHLYIPMNVFHIGKGAFEGCNLEKIEVDNQNTTFHSKNNCLIQTKERKLIYACKKNSTIPSDGTVEIVGKGALYDWECEELVIPARITHIESSAFSYSIKRLIIPHSVFEIDVNAFLECSNLIINYEGTVNEWRMLFSDYNKFEREAKEKNIQVRFSPSKPKFKIGDEVIFWNSVKGSVTEISEDFQKIKVCVPIINFEMDFNANDISLFWNTIGPITYPIFYTAEHEDGTMCRISNIEVLRNGSQIQVVFLAEKSSDEDGNNSKTEIGFRYKLKDSSGVIVCNSTWREYGLCVGETIRSSITFSNITSPGYVLEFNDYD